MDVKDIGKAYLTFLEAGAIDNILSLFAKNGEVVSPLYGAKPASEFYKELQADTQNSSITLNGIFTEELQNRMALLFTYEWTLINGEVSRFDVVDIFEFDSQSKITKLTIIYDTLATRKLKEALR
ncbi:MAG: nuclear transport factor 2 family protein [Eudoraea sp.]|nr:nuclear transport factor 2 family protein [Eudoraea sp.]